MGKDPGGIPIPACAYEWPGVLERLECDPHVVFGRPATSFAYEAEWFEQVVVPIVPIESD